MSPNALLNVLESAKWVFVGLYVLSTIGVTVGVYWEGDQFDKAKQHRGWMLLICALAADTFFTIMVFGIEGWVGHIQRNEIIALETRIAPRFISVDARNRIIEKMKHVKSQEYFGLVASDVSDAWDIWREIALSLDTAGWKRLPPTGLSASQDGPPAGIPIAPLAGVMILFSANSPADLQSAGKALSDAIEAEGIASGAGPALVDRPEAISIIIGTKPQ
jgi:hypothetical protein